MAGKVDFTLTAEQQEKFNLIYDETKIKSRFSSG
jgi:hypothetical protein